jgi:DNA-binding response OmpR family regulator
VVEDHDDTRETLALFLQTEGYEVVLAADGETGMEAARASEPNVAIVDIFLPRKDGVTVIAELCRDLPAVTIIAVSADTSHDRRGALIRAREAGAHLTLRKPLERGAFARSANSLGRGWLTNCAGRDRALISSSRTMCWRMSPI